MFKKKNVGQPTHIWRRRADGFLTRHFSGETLDYRQVIGIFIPILIDQSFLVSLNLLNTAMISSSGVAAVSAVNMVDSLNIFLINIFIAIATGGTVVVAQYKGSRNEGMVSKAVMGSVSAAFSLAFFLTLLLVGLHGLILQLLFGQAAPDVFANAQLYLLGSCLSYGGIAIVEAVCGALRGIGETRSSLMLSLIMHLSYVFLNFLLITHWNMGVLGMVISLNVARYLAAIVALAYLVRRKSAPHFKFKELFHFDFSMLKRIFSIGVPFAAESMFFNGGKILTQTFIVGLGTFAMATNAIAISINALFMIPAGAISLSVVTVVGQCMGRKDLVQAKKLVRSLLVTAAVFFAIMAAIILPLFYPILSLFHPPDEIIPNIRTLIFISSVAQIPLWGFSFLMPAALRAAGDAKYTSIVSMLSMWLFRVGFGYLLGVVLPFGIIGVWVAMFCEWGVRGFIFTKRFRGKKWYLHRVID